MQEQQAAGFENAREFGVGGRGVLEVMENGSEKKPIPRRGFEREVVRRGLGDLEIRELLAGGSTGRDGRLERVKRVHVAVRVPFGGGPGECAITAAYVDECGGAVKVQEGEDRVNFLRRLELLPVLGRGCPEIYESRSVTMHNCTDVE